jgi:hypothetical protein
VAAVDFPAVDFAGRALAGARLRGTGFAGDAEADGAGAGRSVSGASGSWSTEQPYQLRNYPHRPIPAASRIHYESSKVPTDSQTPPVQ